ncbi:unnamed protein product, partial [Vitis vinifera]
MVFSDNIFYEGHQIWNPNAKVIMLCKQLQIVHHVIMTGAPIQNKLAELWSLFDFVFLGKLGVLPVFEAEVAVPISVAGYANASPLQTHRVTDGRVKPSDTSTTRRSSSWSFGFLVLILTPVAAAIFLYQLDSFDPASLPTHEFSQEPMPVPKLNPRMLQGSEMIGQGNLLGPEDIAYDANSHLIYTGCADGWVKRVTLNESAANSVVHNWAFTGGRPLGVALGRVGEVLVADAEKGLLEISGDGVMKLLTDEAEGLKFKQTNAVDVAVDGMIYFTDASYKYGLIEFIWEILEVRPHGRLLSFDPSTQETIVLLRDLYLANGVVVSPDQTSVVFCETLMKRYTKYYIQGKRKGSV